MIALLQRVSRASVCVHGETVGAIGPGLLVLVAVERGDDESHARRMAERLLAYRVFADEQQRMNRDLRDVGGSLLLVPQFTLAADTRKGNRPSFTGAADPAAGRALFDRLVAEVAQRWPHVATGRFGAEMAVSLVNEGPVTIWLQVPPDRDTAASGSAAQ
jgi:D-tyrosyl-tRNA(Tyr) deacylase